MLRETFSGLPSEARRLGSLGERRLERETGIEPATNSLEGCDSTTELLPPTRSRSSFRHATADKPADVIYLQSAFASRRSWRETFACRWLAHRRSLCPGERRLVAREGLEPSKPLGRQIYSLLRLTASLPRRYCARISRARRREQGETAWPAPPSRSALRRTRTVAAMSSRKTVWIFAVRDFPCGPPGLNPLSCSTYWSWRRDLNPRPADYKSAALPD